MTTLTRLEFRQRFTEAEKVAIELSSLDDPSAPMPQRQMSAALRVYLADLAVATLIDPTRADTIAGVNRLEQFGIIAPGRAAEILALPADLWPAVGGFTIGQRVRVLAPFNVAFPDEYEVEGFGPESVVISGGGSFAPMYLEAA
jgi:hypothetical protein